MLSWMPFCPLAAARKILLLLVLCGVLTGCQASVTPDLDGSNTLSVQEVGTGTDAASAGQTLFFQRCGICHRAGSLPNGMDRLVPRSAKMANLETFTRYLREPSMGMPSFGPEDISNEQARSLYEFLKKTYAQPPAGDGGA
ncbi:MAG: cytochrome c [Candidatus Melainabacteria bacterium]|nr:cytochrome c [Candidatus Melainabacteria bacterium]